MADIVIFAEQDVSGFWLNENFGLYCYVVSPKPASLVVGEAYTVNWDGGTYTCTAQDASALNGGAEMIAIGNGSAFGMSGNNEPFIIATTAEDLLLFVVDPSDSSDTHRIGIYQGTEDDTGGEDDGGDSGEEETQEGIVLKDRKGNDVAYYGVETVTFDTTAEGKQQVYTKGVAVDVLEIVPDFSSGDMTVTAGEDTMAKSVAIPAPADLSPENVRKGKSIAGVDGTFIGDTEEVVVELAMADGDQVIVPSEDDKVISKVTVKKPETLVPENIAEDIEIGGVIGTFKGGDIEDALRYFKCHIDPVAGTITLYEIFYNLIYADTGSYDVTIPDTFAGMNVIIATS